MKKDRSALFVKKCLKLFRIKVNSKTEKLLIQIFKFGIVGGIAFIIDYISLIIGKEFFHFSTLLAAGIAFTISVIYNYTASVKWVFDVNSEKNKKKQFVEFISFSIVGLLLNDLIMWICVDKFSVYYLLSKIIATAIVMVFNFITRKMFLE